MRQEGSYAVGKASRQYIPLTVSADSDSELYVGIPLVIVT